ncbi:MAG: dephospho-CoA kinase [Bacteroidota bacterium]
MKVVGVTGGIGSGKTTVCKIFELLGVPVFYADAEAKKLYDNAIIKSKVVKLFGKKILEKDGNVDKTKLASIVFNDKPSLAKINSLIHPAVRKLFHQWKNRQKGVTYVIEEAAIMVESGVYKEIDYLISINSPTLVRINRVIKSYKLTTSEIKKRMQEQISDKEREQYADAIISNDGRHSLIEQALRIHEKLLLK